MVHLFSFSKNDSRFQCERNVTTILCVHEPLCDPPDCSSHGTCELGTCHCHDNWAGSRCDVLKCKANCHGVGTCSEGISTLKSEGYSFGVVCPSTLFFGPELYLSTYWSDFDSFIVQMISTMDSRYPISFVKIDFLTLELLPLF